MYAHFFVYFQLFPRDSVLGSEQNTWAHALLSWLGMNKGFTAATGGKEGGQCFGKEMEKEGKSQQETPFPYEHLWK